MSVESTDRRSLIEDQVSSRRPNRWLIGRTLDPTGMARFALYMGVILLLCGESLASTAAERLAILENQYQSAFSHFVQEIESVAGACDHAEAVELANTLRHLELPFEPQSQNIDHLPTQSRPDLPANLPPAEKSAWIRVRKLQVDYAAELYGLARKAIKDQHPSFAYRLVREILQHDPDHAQTRALLGYRRQGKEWTTPFALEKKRKGEVWHDDFGWIPAKHVDRYLAGERFYNGRWITAEREEVIRSDFDNGWDVKTEHFLVHTNYSQKKGAQLAASVEVFRSYFMREFAAFFKTPQQLDKLFAGGAQARDGNPHEIYFFRQRQEFVNFLTKDCPIAGEINGIYMPQHRKAYFFYDPDISEEESLDTLYHEVTHQLLSESTTKTEFVGHSRDFWAIEGIACYHESFRVAEDGTMAVGDPNHNRIQAARDQVVNKEQEPFARFTAMGMVQFQTAERPILQKRYAQATGLTHFLMNYQNAMYRDGFIEYLSQIYSPDRRVRDNAKTLEQILGVPHATLDKQYVSYFQALSREKPVPVAKGEILQLPPRK